MKSTLLHTQVHSHLQRFHGTIRAICQRQVSCEQFVIEHILISENFRFKTGMNEKEDYRTKQFSSTISLPCPKTKMHSSSLKKYIYAYLQTLEKINCTSIKGELVTVT